MARAIGKQFEDNIKDSCPDWLLVYRPPDAAQAFNMSSKLRFSRHSPADFFFLSRGKWIFLCRGMQNVSRILFFRENERRYRNNSFIPD